MADEKTAYSAQNEREYWRSPESLTNKVMNNGDEFPDNVKEEFNPERELSGMSRRKFFALIGASAAVAAAGCNDYRDKGEIVPYSQRPEEILPGVPNYYASTCTGCSRACGVLIKTREGRPIKIDGNPDHPVSKGKICPKGQANILNLYDPARIRKPLKKEHGRITEVSFKEIDKAIIKQLKTNDDKEIALVTHSIHSPTEQKVLNAFKETYPNVKIYTYDFFHEKNRENAWKKCYGEGSFPVLKWNEADVILSLEGDFLGTEGHPIEQMRLFTERRDITTIEKFNRLYVVEGNMSMTGMNADYRMRLRPDAQYEFVLALLHEIINKSGNPESPVAEVLASLPKATNLVEVIEKFGLNAKYANQLIADLLNAKGKGIIYAGRMLEEKVHIAVNLLNEVLGNSKLYCTTRTNVNISDFEPEESFEELISKMNEGSVKLVLHYDTNPVYQLPNDLGYTEALKNVDISVSMTELPHETSAECDYTLPIHHMLEAWGDHQIRTGIYSLQQPVIAPLYGSRQKEVILLTWIQGDFERYSDTMYHEFLKNNWETVIYPTFSYAGDFKTFWFASLHDGVVLGPEEPERVYTLLPEAGATLVPPKTKATGFAVVITESFSLYDGRFSNNGWLQELPHPVSKITWDNYAAISYNTAKTIGVETNDLIEVSLENRSVTLPVLVQPGLADDMIAVEYGYGRTNVPIVSSGVGVDAGILISKDYTDSPWLYDFASVTKLNKTYELASTQEHHRYEDFLSKDQHLKRDIIQEGTVAEYQKNKEFLRERRHEMTMYNLYEEYEYNTHKWAMAIDLNKCIGCGVCISACNVENNIPVVGKDQVLVSREMQWMRLDRYYSGPPEDPKVSTMPMLCQHCDQAPCENVCPVVATTHSPDGLNQMVYNRCVGTRYCSNNCPYKVRRFNFFDFRDHFAKGYYYEPSVDLTHNPEVTVRSRGVMEKCTFCIQRIKEAQYNAEKEGKKHFRGSDIQTACQQACPTGAIIFGDMTDKDSELMKLKQTEIGYVVLELMNVKPNVTYIAKLKNIETEEA